MARPAWPLEGRVQTLLEASKRHEAQIEGTRSVVEM